MNVPLVVLCTDPAGRERADQLAVRLGLPRASDWPDEGQALVVTADRLELRACGRGAPGPVAADFRSSRMAWRERHASLRNEALARAVGLGRGKRPDVIDATAGLGRDSYMLAALGCRVRAYERHPVVAALLADGLERARADPASAVIAGRIELVTADAVGALGGETTDVVLVDPMHPPRRKSAAVRKEMRLFQALLGERDDADAVALLAAALSAARERVVVKRPRNAPSLAGREPVSVIRGRSTRFDVYRGQAGDPS